MPDLHALAESHLATTLERDGQTVTLTNPAGVSQSIKTISNDIALLIDPDTGVPVSGRNANATLRISTLRSLGFEIPTAIQDNNAAPWRLTYTTVNGDVIDTRVLSTDPDRALGLVVLRLDVI